MSDKKLGIDELAAFCKKKGFVYPSGDIYGGFAGFWDFGHLGVELVNNIKREWWKFHVNQREDIVGIDGSIITNPKVWEASGHVESFMDIAVVCKKCKHKSKLDEHELGNVKCEKCGGEYENKGSFHPMMITNVGPIEKESIKSYLRPETAQTIFTNFKFVHDNARMKLPFGIAQVGKAFRNEIAPREFLFRTREFDQMEIEYFIKKGMKCPYIDEIKGTEIEVFTEDMQKKGKKAKKMKIYDAWKKKVIKTDWHAYWLATEYQWFLLLGASPENFRLRQHVSEEKSHYAVDTWDLEFNFPMGWRELQGLANRGCYDLKQHEKHSKKSMEIFDEASGKKVLPEVVCEPSLGLGRAFLVFMFDAYEHDKKRDNVVLHLDSKLAPYKAAVLPIVSKGEVADVGYEIFRDLVEEFNVLYDKSGSIGRRYSRNDEIGTPYCITVDNDTIKDKRVTVRERDSTNQIRVDVKGLRDLLRKLVFGDVLFGNAGENVDTRKKD
jgi:glycyl-tRNA synthetase